MEKLKVFDIDIYTWVCAYNAKQAVKIFSDSLELGSEGYHISGEDEYGVYSVFGGDPKNKIYVHELSDKDLEEQKFKRSNGEVITFKERLKELNEPCIFACTNWFGE